VIGPQRLRRHSQQWHGRIISELTNVDHIVMIAAASQNIRRWIGIEPPRE
jgi:hypothetical protein